MTATRIADVQLRGASGWLRPRLYWPARPDRVPGLLVTYGVAAPACGELCARAGVVVVTAGVPDVEDALAVLGWAADHAADLDASPARLLVAGVGAGAALVDGVLPRVHDAGWPQLAAVLRFGSPATAVECLLAELVAALGHGGTDEIRRGLTS